VHGDAAQVVVGGPDETGLLADQRRECGGVGDRVQEGLGAEVGADGVDGEPERGGQFDAL
jgi:hypothetical protein